jgi:hypothetical protein
MFEYISKKKGKRSFFEKNLHGRHFSTEFSESCV